MGIGARTCREELLQGVVEVLGGGGVHPDVHWLQPQVQGPPDDVLDVARQAAEVLVDGRNHLLLLLVGGDLQLVPELLDLQAHGWI